MALTSKTPMLEKVESLLPQDIQRELNKLQQDAGVAITGDCTPVPAGVGEQLKNAAELVTNKEYLVFFQRR